MRNDNITKWADDLLTTDAKQVTGSLCLISGESKAYCCLGKGSLLVPAMPEAIESGGHYVLFGATMNRGLAPSEFMTWLGYHDLNGHIQHDVYFDMPDNLLTQVPPDDEEVQPLNEISAASLNDGGFTFAQIGQLIKHFGLCDTPYPVTVEAA